MAIVAEAERLSNPTKEKEIRRRSIHANRRTAESHLTSVEGRKSTSRRGLRLGKLKVII